MSLNCRMVTVNKLTVSLLAQSPLQGYCHTAFKCFVECHALSLITLCLIYVTLLHRSLLYPTSKSLPYIVCCHIQVKVIWTQSCLQATDIYKSQSCKLTISLSTCYKISVKEILSKRYNITVKEIQSQTPIQKLLPSLLYTKGYCHTKCVITVIKISIVT